jgi:Sec-independent protein translocase protein TatA
MKWIRSHWRTIADGIAVLAFFVIASIGAATIEGDKEIAAPTTVTTVTNERVAGTAKTRTKTTKDVTRTGNRPTTTKTTTVTRGPTPAKPAETKVTTEDGERSFVERVLGEGGLTILQFAIVVAAAFLAAAILQRVLVGEYGGFEFGSFKLSSVARTSATGLKELRDDLDKLTASLKEHAAESDSKLKGTEADLKADLAIAYKRIDLIDKRLDRLNSDGSP